MGLAISNHQLVQLTEKMIDDADLVVIIGSQAHFANHPGTRIQRWDTDQPSTRGIDGIERMRIIRDDINTLVRPIAAGARR